MNKTKIFITIFLASLLIGNPFVIKKLASKNNIEQISDSEIDYNSITELGEDTNQTNNQIQQKSVTIKKIKADKSYFDDALFIGDSRTVGISEYSDLKNATYFANTGMSVYNVIKEEVSINSIGKVKLEKLLETKQFGKIYIMLGINELGYDNNQNIKTYKDVVKFIQNKKPDSIIYIEANLHVTAEKNKQDKVFNNTNINKFNNAISKLANNENIFYININEHFDDKEGNLRSDYTHDNVHIYAKYYKEWGDWISSQAIVKQ